MNKVILMGRFTKDPEVRYNDAQLAIARGTIAVDRRTKKEGEATADFVSVKAFGKTAEFIEKYMKKGTKVVTEGRIQTGNYTNKDGVTVFTTDVVIDNIEFAESKGNSNNTAPADDADGFMPIPDGIAEELPFA